MTGPHAQDEEVRLLPYDPAWPGMFAAEAELLEAAIGAWAPGGIHHVGSTAVPGLAAKPVIDILVGVASLEASRPCLELLAPLEYQHYPYRPDEMHWFCKPDPASRTHHLHLVPTDSQRFDDELAFRDYLRSHADRAGQYEQLKLGLAVRFRHDRESYTAAKGNFIGATLALARR